MVKHKIILTGGGSAGHVTPNIALLPFLKDSGYEIVYIGSKNGIEKELISRENIRYYGVSSGKLRRYFDIKNFTDPFRVIGGLFQCIKILKKEKPSIVFSKGGFVAVPVIIAAKMLKIPAIAHESDMTPGLANKLSMPYCTKVCVTFDSAIKHIGGDKGVLTGTPIRGEILKGNIKKGLEFLGFDGKKEVLLIMGGSLGSKFINDSVRGVLNRLLKGYDVVHLCGNGHLDDKLKGVKGYMQFEYLRDEIFNVITAADYIISRAGANSIFEFLTLAKPNILIPLSKSQSRGDQILNARYFKEKGYSLMIEEEDLTEENLINLIKELKDKKNELIDNMKKSKEKNGTENIINLIKKYDK